MRPFLSGTLTICVLLFPLLSRGHLIAQSDSTGKFHLDEGIRRYYSGQYQSAMEHFRRALNQDASLIRAYDFLGRCAAGLGDCDKADQFFRDGLDLDSLNLDLMVEAAQVLLECGLAGKSEAYFGRILQRVPTHVNAMIGMSRICSQRADYGKAITYLNRALTVDPHNLQLHYMLGSSYLAFSRPQKAVGELQMVLRANPRHFAALKDLGTAYFLLDSLAGAAILLRQALNIDSTNPNLRLTLANCYYKRKQYAQAVSLYRTLETMPFLPTTYVQEGLCFFYLSRFDSAISRLSMALSLDSTIGGAHFNIGLCLAQQHKYRDAILEFSKAIRYSKDEIIASSYDRIGTAYYELKQKESALEAFRHAVMEDSDNARGFYDMGVLYENLYSDRQSAIQCYGKVIDLGRRLRGARPLSELAEKRLNYLISGEWKTRKP